MKNEWNEFSSIEPITPPHWVTRAVEFQVRSELEVSSVRVAFKLIVIQALSGALTLSFCPQFGFGPWGGGDGIMGLLMRYGHHVCALGCGAAFFVLTAWVAVLVLRPVEMLTVYRRKLLFLPALVGFYFFLGMLGGSAETDFQWNLLWSVSALTTLALSYACVARLRLGAAILRV
jgi:hypothetical protein